MQLMQSVTKITSVAIEPRKPGLSLHCDVIQVGLVQAICGAAGRLQLRRAGCQFPRKSPVNPLMPYFSKLSADEQTRYFALLGQALGVRRHFDLLLWLQGDVQHFLPHDIMLAAWGDFRLGLIAHDIVSALPGVRTQRTSVASVSPMLSGLFKRWFESGRKPFAVRVGEAGFVLDDSALDADLGGALRNVRSALVHGICDERGRHDCLYVLFSSNVVHGEGARATMEILLPYLDMALRQVPQLHTEQAHHEEGAAAPCETQEHGLTEREIQIMTWVKAGKTNQEIGMILDISAFTVKNHLKRIFKKLTVYNRMQAVAKFEAVSLNGAN